MNSINQGNLTTFIVPAFNAEATIAQCLESVMSQGIQKEIIVVDNASTDNTASVIKRYPVKYILEAKRGPSAAKNAGLHIYDRSSEFIAFVDSDVVLPEGWAMKAVALLTENTELAGAGGPGKSICRNAISVQFDYLLYGKTASQKMMFVNSLATMNALYRRSSIQDIYFNEELIAAEDPDFNYRIQEKGYKLLYTDELWVFHHHPATIKMVWAKWFNYGKYYPLPYLMNNRIGDLGLWVRIVYLPVLVSTLVLCAFSQRLFILPLLTISSLPFSYSILGWKAGLRHIVEIIRFSLLHSFKQMSQLLGIWYGFFVRVF